MLLPVAAISAYAQDAPQQISGTYKNEAAGVEITFPSGWSGFAVSQTPETTLVATSPGGLSESDPETMKTIDLLVTDKASRDVNDPSSLTQDVSDCDEPLIASKTVAGVQGTEITVECPSTDQKFRMVAVETESDIVAVMYMTPASEFDSNLAAFDSAVSSLKVQGAIGTTGAPNTPSEQPTSTTQSVMVAGAAIQLAVMSSSTISNFALNEESKMVSFKTDGSGTETAVTIGKVLNGPYTVMVDGQETNDYKESTGSDGTKTITTSHGTGQHDVTITGTQVVPEFPLAMLGALTAVVGAVAVLGRFRLLR